MATIVTRVGKGSPLLNTEVDANFTNLNADKIETADIGVTVEAYLANPAQDGYVLTSTAAGVRSWVEMSGAWTSDANGNLFYGTGAGAALTTGSNNILGGLNSGAAIDAESDNLALGTDTISQSTSFGEIVALGARAGKFGAGWQHSVLVGAGAGEGVAGSAGALRTVAVGYDALTNITNGSIADLVAIGYQALGAITQGADSVAVGRGALSIGNRVIRATAIGSYALRDLDTGAVDSHDAAIGFGAGQSLTTGIENAALGAMSMWRITTGSQNTAVGYRAGDNANGASSGNVFIGNDSGPTALGQVDNKLFIDNSQTDTPLIGGDFAANTVTINGALTVTGTITAASVADKLSLPASTVSEASLLIPHGTAPTVPVNGDVWTTTEGMFAHINGVTVGPFGAGAKSNTSTAAGTIGWHTIAIGRNITGSSGATFFIRGGTNPTYAKIEVAVENGVAHIVATDFLDDNIDSVRVKQGSDPSDAVLQVSIDTAGAQSFTCYKLLEGGIWDLVNLTEDSIDPGVTNGGLYSSFTVVGQTSLSVGGTNQFGVSFGGADVGFKELHLFADGTLGEDVGNSRIFTSTTTMNFRGAGGRYLFSASNGSSIFEANVTTSDIDFLDISRARSFYTYNGQFDTHVWSIAGVAAIELDDGLDSVREFHPRTSVRLGKSSNPWAEVYSTAQYVGTNTNRIKLFEYTNLNPDFNEWHHVAQTMRNMGSFVIANDDESFETGNGNFLPVNDGVGVNITITRAAAATNDPGINDVPNSSGQTLKISWDGTGSPAVNDGGFSNTISNTNLTFNRHYAFIIHAKIPNGATINHSGFGSFGTNASSEWITGNTGTGKYEWYVYLVHSGSATITGSFGDFTIDNTGAAWDVFVASGAWYDVGAKKPTITVAGSPSINQLGVWDSSGAMRGYPSLFWNNSLSTLVVGSSTYTGSGDHNFIMHIGAGAALTTGADNILIGETAGNALTDQEGNIALGFESGQDLTSPRNVAIGFQSMGAIGTTGGSTGENVSIGYLAGSSIAVGSTCVAIGARALSGASQSGSNNVAIGHQAIGGIAGHNLSSLASENVAIGGSTLGSLSSGTNNTVIGHGAGANLTIGGGNVIIGHGAGPTVNTTEQLFIDNIPTDTPLIHGNFAVGAEKITINGDFEVTGTSTIPGVGGVFTENGTNIVGGTGAGAAVTTGNNLFLAGSGAADTITTSVRIFSIGANSLDRIDPLNGANSIINIGTDGLRSLTGGNDIISIGHRSMDSITANSFSASNIISIGNNNLTSNSYDGLGNDIVIGNGSLTAITTGQQNIVIGHFSGNQMNDAVNNIIIGSFESGLDGSSFNNVVIGPGWNSTAVRGNQLYIDSAARSDPLIGGDFSSRIIELNGSVTISNLTLSSIQPKFVIRDNDTDFHTQNSFVSYIAFQDNGLTDVGSIGFSSTTDNIFRINPGINGLLISGSSAVNVIENVRLDTAVGFFGTAPILKPTVSGSTGANAALQSLLTALSNLGLITDSTT